MMRKTLKYLAIKISATLGLFYYSKLVQLRIKKFILEPSYFLFQFVSYDVSYYFKQE